MGFSLFTKGMQQWPEQLAGGDAPPRAIEAQTEGTRKQVVLLRAKPSLGRFGTCTTCRCYSHSAMHVPIHRQPAGHRRCHHGGSNPQGSYANQYDPADGVFP